jgi:uracil-DNA glycosylase
LDLVELAERQGAVSFDRRVTQTAVCIANLGSRCQGRPPPEGSPRISEEGDCCPSPERMIAIMESGLIVVPLGTVSTYLSMGSKTYEP